MKVVVLEFNKKSTLSIDEFSDLVQDTINKNNDLLDFRPYESAHNGCIKIELLFGTAKTCAAEVIGFGPGLVPDLLEQLNSTLAVASNQLKKVRFAGFIPMSETPRSVAFLVLEKSNSYKGTDASAESNKAQERSQDKAANERAVRRRKSSE